MVWNSPSIWPAEVKLAAPMFGLATLVALALVLQGLIAADIISRYVVPPPSDVLAAFGRVTVLVNNAGIIRLAPFIEMSDAMWSEVLNVNLTGMFIVAQEAARHMCKQGSGRIINMASASAHVAHSGQARIARYDAERGKIFSV